jgi:hypothetical protein
VIDARRRDRPPVPARSRVELQEEGLSSLILGLFVDARAARAAFQLAVTWGRLAGLPWRIVLIDQAVSPE